MQQPCEIHLRTGLSRACHSRKMGCPEKSRAGLQRLWVVRPGAGLFESWARIWAFASLSETFSDHTLSSNPSLISTCSCHSMPQTATHSIFSKLSLIVPCPPSVPRLTPPDGVQALNIRVPSLHTPPLTAIGCILCSQAGLFSTVGACMVSCRSQCWLYAR